MTAAHLDEFIILSAVRVSQIRLAIYTNFRAWCMSAYVAGKLAGGALTPIAPAAAFDELCILSASSRRHTRRKCRAFCFTAATAIFQILKFKVNSRI